MGRRRVGLAGRAPVRFREGPIGRLRLIVWQGIARVVRFTIFLCFFGLFAAGRTAALELPDLIDQSRSSIVAIGTVLATRRPPNQLVGTGFVIGGGRTVVTNAHVLPNGFDTGRREKLAVFSGRGRKMRVHWAEIRARDDTHDLAVLSIAGQPLPALVLGDSDTVREGQDVAFIGYPVAGVLGLFPATHRGIISAITPVVIPADRSRQLTAKQVALLRDPYQVFQLDATAYPGNSGSPLLSLSDGAVIGIINKVLVKGTRENVLKDPSNITYAVPARHLRGLLAEVRR